MAAVKYITTNLDNGRLGNQLFQVAAVVGTGLKHGYIPFIKDWGYSKYLNTKTLDNHDFFDLDWYNRDNIKCSHIYHEPNFHYTDINIEDALLKADVNPEILNLLGYYQSSRYFDHCKDEIKRLFLPAAGLIRKLSDKYPDLLSGTTCSIHVRRGDYVGNDYYADILSDGYYGRAIDYIKEQTNIDKFLIFSDDPEWCKDTFHGDNFIYIEGNSDIEDLFLQSLCSHNIIANSSFSFWSAWLNPNKDKIIVAPEKWFGTNTVLDTKDLIPAEWVKI